MLGTPRIHVHPMIIFLRGSLLFRSFHSREDQLLSVLRIQGKRGGSKSIETVLQGSTVSRRYCTGTIASLPFCHISLLRVLSNGPDTYLCSIPFHGHVNQGGYFIATLLFDY